VPYAQFTNKEVIEQVLAGYRLAPPENAPSEVAALMIACWDKESDKRPSFKVD
jgi:hypothetical protein